MLTVLIDNYDSFTYNLYQYLIQAGTNVIVYRNDKVSLSQLISLNPSNIVLSPGPGEPKTNCGNNYELLDYFKGKIPIFGVCLGHQTIIDYFGGKIRRMSKIVHGKTSLVKHSKTDIFKNVSNPFSVNRYHSLHAEIEDIPEDELLITAHLVEANRNSVQAVQHKIYTIFGVQFHPESILTTEGLKIIKNFLEIKGGKWSKEEIGTDLSLAKVEKSKEDAFCIKTKENNSSILEKIHKQTIERIEQSKRIFGTRYEDLQNIIFNSDDVLAKPISLYDVLKNNKVNSNTVKLMAEIKRASPSKGDINPHVNVLQQAKIYYESGASVISVLTEPLNFKGSLTDMLSVARYINRKEDRTCIVLRKDFIIEEYQILESRIALADTILLIVALIKDETRLKQLIKFSRSLDMEPLVEVNTKEEVDIALNAGSRCIGINNRNLHTFKVDKQTAIEINKMLPKDVFSVALSGIASAADCSMYMENGFKGILVGESLMKSNDPKQLIKDLLLEQDEGTR